MSNTEKLRAEIARQKRMIAEDQRQKSVMLQTKMKMKRRIMERRELERELDLLKNPKKAEAIRGLKRQGRFVGGLFKKVFDAVPDPHAPKPKKKVVRRVVKRKPVKRKATKRKPTKRKKR